MVSTGAGIEVGQMILDRYQILELIGRGGMANVWLARDERLGKLWAIKEIKPNTKGMQAEAFRQALIDEAHLMKSLDHASIPRIVDIADTGATTFVVMDYVEGSSLGALLHARSEPFDEKQVIAWGIQLCDVLGYLHARTPKIVYRDLKPANVIAREDGTVRLIDFGIALEEGHVTPNNQRVVGTPGYAAPEQMRGANDASHQEPGAMVDERADVYALGATLYTLVTKHEPTVHQHNNGQVDTTFTVRPIRQWNARLSEGLERIIARALCADPKRRYANMREMRYDLEHYTELTDAWRAEQTRKIARVKHRAVAATLCLMAGIVLLAGGALVEKSTFANVMYEARSASREAANDASSDAERLLCSAIELAPASLEPYERLLDVYEADYRLTESEARRLQATFGRATALEKTPGYARLCYDVGMCYLGYYGVDYAGGSVGNAALTRAAAAIPWLERAVAASEDEAKGTASSLSEASVQAAKTYETLASFYDEVNRAIQEGRSSEEVYCSFFEALESSLTREVEASEADKSTEGMRARLCQMASETLSSPTYLAGLSRAGITQTKAEQLLDLVHTCFKGLEEFSATDEARGVYGPLFDEVRKELVLAERNIPAVFHNPVSTYKKEESV